MHLLKNFQTEKKKDKKPWVTKGIATAINKRNSFLKKFLETKDQF